jgi:diguanylate cyclase (GGDEF)-like protein
MDSSLHSLLVGRYSEEIVSTRCKRPMLERLVRHFEDLVVENNLPALVLEGHCLDGERDAELRRFFRLSAAARHHYIFSCGPNCPERTWSAPIFPNCTVLQRGDFHTVDTGPFILIVSPKFSGVLASAKSPVAGGDDEPSYQMAWSFDPGVVFTTLEYLTARVSAEHPNYEAVLAGHLRENAPLSSSLRLTLNFMTKLAVMMQRQAEMETATSRISALVSSTFDLGEILQGAVNQIAKSLDVRQVTLSVWNEMTQVPEAAHASTYARGRSTASAISSADRPAPIKAPIAMRGRETGVLTVEDDTPGRVWQEEELTMVRTVADHLAVGIGHARLFKHINEQAITDELTGLFNKRYFVDRLELEMQFATRSGKAVSLIIFDLDHMKRVNDTYGHVAGDTALRYVGRTMRMIVRTIDVCARYGGEEFVVIPRPSRASGTSRRASGCRRSRGPRRQSTTSSTKRTRQCTLPRPAGETAARALARPWSSGRARGLRSRRQHKAPGGVRSKRSERSELHTQPGVTVTHGDEPLKGAKASEPRRENPAPCGRPRGSRVRGLPRAGRQSPARSRAPALRSEVAELIAVLRTSGNSPHALVESPNDGGRIPLDWQPPTEVVEDDHAAGVDPVGPGCDVGDVLEGDAHRQVSCPAAAVVRCRQRRPEAVLGFSEPLRVPVVVALRHKPVASVAQALFTTVAVEDQDRAGVLRAIHRVNSNK